MRGKELIFMKSQDKEKNDFFIIFFGNVLSRKTWGKSAVLLVEKMVTFQLSVIKAGKAGIKKYNTKSKGKKRIWEKKFGSGSKSLWNCEKSEKET